MTTDEKLDLLLDKFGAVEKRLDKIEERLDKIEERLDKIEERLDKVEERLDKVEENQLKTTEVLENTINTCIKVLSEAHTLNSERFDKYDIESITRNSEIAATLARITSDKVDRFLESQKSNIA